MPRLVILAAVLAALAAPVDAAPKGPRGTTRVTVDRVDVEPSPLHGMARVRLFVSAIDLDTVGSVIPVPGAAWAIDAAGLKRVPFLVGRFAAAESPLAVVLVVQTDQGAEPGYDADLEAIKAALADEVLAPLGARDAQVAVIGYGDELATGKLGSADQAKGQLGKLVSTGAASTAPKLLDAVERAIKLLQKAEPDAMRRMIVVVGDGRDEDEDRERATRLASRADKRGIRIHAVAYSATDQRRPLFTLGELSKGSQGTFRWVQRKVDDTSLRTPFKKLAEEIDGQYVLTMFVPETDVPAGRKVEVTAEIGGKDVESLGTKVPQPACGDAACATGQYCLAGRCVARRGEEGRGFLGWLLLLGAIVVGGFFVLVGIGFTITKLRDRSPSVPVPVPVPGAPGPVPVPGGPVLYILSGPLTGTRVPLRHGFQIGKAPTADLSLAHDGFASTNHAEIHMDPHGNCLLVDKQSTNGTFVNGVRVQEARLADGMSIRCGSTELRYLAHG